MYRLFSIRTLIPVIITVILCGFVPAAAQSIQWQPLTDFHAGTCRNAIEDGSGNLFFSTPVTNGWDFRGILRYDGTTGDVADIGVTPAPIRSYDTTAAGRLFCATEEGMFYSDNNGTDWLRDPQLGSAPAYLVRTLRGTCYAVADSGVVHRYDDAQQQWQRLGAITMTPYQQHISIRSKAIRDLVADSTGRLFLLTQFGAIHQQNLQTSTDGGVTWEPLGILRIISFHASPRRDGVLFGDGVQLMRVRFPDLILETIPGVSGAVTGIVEDDGGVLYLALGEPSFPWHPDSTRTFGVMRSTDGGDRWTWLRDDIPVNHLAFMQDGRLFCSSPTDGSLIMDPASGDTSRLPIPYGNVTNIVTTPDGAVNVAVDSSVHLELYRSTDNGETWAQRRSGIAQYDMCRPRLILDDRGRLTLGGGIWSYASWMRTVDGGRTFSKLQWNGVVAAALPEGKWVTATSRCSYRDSTTEAYFSDDDGGDWQRINIPFIAAVLERDAPYDIESVHPGHVLASGRAGLAFQKGGHGSPWSRVGNWKPTDISVTEDGMVYVGTRDTTFSFIRSTDHGQTWQAFGIEDSLAVNDALHASGGVLVTTARHFDMYGEIKPATGGGLRFSSDLVNWSDAGTGSGLPTREVTCLARDSAGYVYAGTRGFGVYRSTVPVSTDGPTVLFAEAPHPARPTLELNVYPQPLASHGSIVCRMPSAGVLTLQLYDLLGRHIRTITGGRRHAAGTHTVTLDVSWLPAGTYVLHARDGAASRSASILLRKL